MTQITKEAIEAGLRITLSSVNMPAGECLHETDVREILEAALSTLPIAGEGKVKALEWHRDEGGHWRRWAAATPFGTYSAWRDGGVYYEGFFIRHCENDEAAKAAAQADYERRILSALISSPVEAVDWTRNDLAKGLARIDGITLRDIKSTVGDPKDASNWREYLGRADDLMAHLSWATAVPQPASTALVEAEHGDLPQSPRPASDWAIEQIERLTKALEPFAQAADDIEQTYGNDLPEWQIQFPQLPMSDFRRARSALSSSSTSREGER